MRVPDQVSDSQTALLRYLMYGLLPAWFIPALLDWNQHGRSRIEVTSGTRESLIHLLMMAEVGAPLTLVLLCEVNPLVLTTILASIAAHEATALWDVSAAEHSGRRVTIWGTARAQLPGVDADHGCLGAGLPALARSPAAHAGRSLA
ncbi:diguanylate cyclase/phosphodiesterase [Mycobacterium sp. E2497]|uniref:diguanylate cyclase/phosphodiesterase n=1 Tax=Mycobacterium sp. E2497 TaxID=1834135 RepID=UPI000A7766C5|nr:diguanylate cyclase/phosphodiesterase [Mycobacterium sp. E2497]